MEAPKMPSAAESLPDGLPLQDGWTIVCRLPKSACATGSLHSVGYLVRNTAGRVAFLKAFDFQSLLERASDLLRELQRALEIYNYERDLLELCRDRKLTHILVPLDQGSVEAPGHTGPLASVYYLIFERADADSRVELSARPPSDCCWFLRLLHEASVALRQLHQNRIAHQDVKPSNLLLFRGSHAKLADLGRATTIARPSPFDVDKVAGDPSYAPFELLYGQLHDDWVLRRFGGDLYLLGSLLFFFVVRVSLTDAIVSRMYGGHHFSVYTGTFDSVLPHLQQAFSEVLTEFSTTLNDRFQLSDDIRTRLVRILREIAEPDPRRRGHPSERNRSNPYDLERYVAEFDLIARRADIDARIRKKL
jgi:serine/threonine protein kinase